ncbi:hypothetical protein RXV95_03175 [Novosphingobium sp. ZN18A2]|uniref:hypothetical protein n=1 Tax=Novosphingobium sp. ZN18A2 TaxID=3079861 RepID=UPI0030D1C7C2
MAGFGFGFRGMNRVAAHLVTVASTQPLPSISPSAGWDGTAASGFASTPADPARSTAKPAMRLMVPPYQWFTDELLVGVYAGASNGGSLLDNMGLEKVIVHYEGESVEIASPSFRSFDDANGNPVTYFGWWAALKHDGRNGHAQVYFEAVPRDATMQHRVIGPYQFSPQAQLHDCSVTVAASATPVAGSVFTNMTDAYNYLRSVNAVNGLITVTEAGTYDLGQVTSNWSNGSWVDGWVNIEASAPVVFTKPAPAADAAMPYFRPNFAIHLRGGNITLDFAHATELYRADFANIRNNWVDCINLTNSNGRYDLFHKANRNGLFALLRAATHDEGAWATECAFSNLWNAAAGLSLSRGCSYDTMWGDLFNSAKCVVGNRVTDFDSTMYQVGLNALTVHYTGAGSAATLERNGDMLTASVDGSTVGTFGIVKDLAGYNANTNYTVQNVVDWLNGLTGFAATLGDDSRAAWMLAPDDGVIPGTWPAVDVKTAAKTFRTRMDVHADWWQLQYGANGENIVIADNVSNDVICQLLFVQEPVTDWLVVNNIWRTKAVWNYGVRMDARASITNACSHVFMAHNTVVGQVFRFTGGGIYNGDFDAYCYVANNAFTRFEWLSAAAEDADLNIVNNHIDGGTSDMNGATGTTIGGDETTLYADAAAGDFTPAGALLADKVVPVVRFDRSRTERASLDSVGALA